MTTDTAGTRPAHKTTYDLYIEAEHLLLSGMEAVDDEVDVWLEDLAAWLDGCADKALALRVVLKGFKDRESSAKDQKDRFGMLQRRAKSQQGRITDMVATLVMAREALAGKQGAAIETTDGGWVKMRPYPKVDDTEADLEALSTVYVPVTDKDGTVTEHRLVTRVVTYKLDAKVAVAALKQGIEIPGLRLDANRRVAWSR